MAGSLTIEAANFDRIRRGDMHEAGNAIELLFAALNDEGQRRRTGVRLAVDRSERAVDVLSPSAAMNDYALDNVSVWQFSGATSVNLTGIVAPSGGAARRLTLFVLGAGTITLKHEHAGSEALNRILTFSAGDLAIATNTCVNLLYLNSRWREMKWA